MRTHLWRCGLVATAAILGPIAAGSDAAIVFVYSPDPVVPADFLTHAGAGFQAWQPIGDVVSDDPDYVGQLIRTDGDPAPEASVTGSRGRPYAYTTPDGDTLPYQGPSGSFLGFDFRTYGNTVSAWGAIWEGGDATPVLTIRGDRGMHYTFSPPAGATGGFLGFYATSRLTTPWTVVLTLPWSFVETGPGPYAPNLRLHSIGYATAVVPEPGTLAGGALGMAVVAGAGLARHRRRPALSRPASSAGPRPTSPPVPASPRR